MQQFIGWFISTLLLRLLGVGSVDSDNEMQPSKYTQTNINQIGSTIPAVLGRVMIKNPLISYYGGFEAKIYTEDYGMWSDLDWGSMILMLIIGIISSIATPNMVITSTGGGTETTQGAKNALMMTNLSNLLMWLLSSIFLNHLGRVTIQKGFKYYLGWQNILCWSGENIGIKKVWMNIYDTEVEDSTMKGAWSNDNATATPYKLYEDNTTINITSTTYSYKVDLMDEYYIDEISFWYQGTMPTQNTSYIPQVDYYISNDDVTWTLLGNVPSTVPGDYEIKYTPPAGTTSVYIRLDMTCADVGGLPIDLNIKDVIVKGKELDMVAYKTANPTGIDAYIDDDEMFGGWDEGGGFIGNVAIYFGGYAQSKDKWMIDEMTKSSNIPATLKGLTPLYPMYMTCVVTNKDKNGGAYIGKQATIPEMWFEVVNYPDYLGTTYHADIRQKYVDRLYDLWQPIEAYRSTLSPAVQAAIQPYMDNCIKAWNDFVVAPNDDTSAMKTALDDALTNFPISDKPTYERLQQPVYELVKHGVWTLGKLDKDLNPAEAIYEILTNKIWGCAYDGSRIDIDSILNLGITCENEKLGISMLMNQTQQVREYLNKIMQHINGVFFDNPLTGKLVFRLLRNDFDIDTIKKFNTSNCVSCQFSRLDWSEAASSVSVKFTDARDKYNTSEMMVNDLANKIIVGSDIQKQVDGSYFTTAVSARWMAQAQLMSAGYPLSMVTLECNRVGFDSLIGDPILVSWMPYGISRQVYRIIDIDYATLTNGKITISAVEDVFSFDKTDYEYGDIPIWDEPEKRPFDIARYMFMEMPYEWTPTIGTPVLDTFVYAYAAQPSNYTLYWDIWRYEAGSYNMSTKSNEWTTCAKLIYPLDEKFDFDTVGFEVAHVGTNSEKALDELIKTITGNPSMYNHNSNTNTIIIAEPGYSLSTDAFKDREIISYDTITKLPSGNYLIQGVVRGILDTLPHAHTTEAILFFNDHSQNVTGGMTPGMGRVERQGLYKDESLEIRTETATQAQPFDITLVENMRTVRRSEMPTVMANMMFGADKGTQTNYWYSLDPTEVISGDILFTFIGRNKFKNFSILEQTDAATSIDVADTTKNVIRISCNGEVFEFKHDARDVTTSTNITTMTMKWVEFCEEMGTKVSVQNAALMEVQTYDDTLELYSYDMYRRNIEYIMPRLVGIVDDPTKVQAYADSIVVPADNQIELPTTPVSPPLSVTFDECPLIFVGTLRTGTSTVTIYGQDGLAYTLSTDAYRVDGIDSSGNAIIHPVTIEDYYIFRTNFTVLVGNFPDYFQYKSGAYTSYIPY